MVQILQLKGHKSSVLSLAHSSDLVSSFYSNPKNRKKKQRGKNLNTTLCHLLSGDETGTTRIWDLRYNSHRASHCILAPNDGDSREVTSVSFHPLFDLDNTCDGISGSPSSEEGSCPFTVYTAVGSKVYGYDLRHTKSPSITSQYDFHISSLDGGEEINNIDLLHMHKQKKTYLATADDDGMLRYSDSIPNKKSNDEDVYKSWSQRPCRTCQHSDDGPSVLVTSLAFRPRSMKSIDIATAGTDYTICLWDVSRPHNRPSSSLFIRQDNDENAAKGGVNQICNPPIVHSLSWSPSGQLLSAGLGDGTCLIASINGRQLVESCRLRDGHDSAVASVLFPRFGSPSSFSHVTAEDRLMISAGNDGSILLWDLGCRIAGSNAVNPSSMFKDCNDDDDEDGKKNDDDASNAMKDLSLSQDNNDSNNEPKILFGIPHCKKTNFMVSSSGEDMTLSNSLFIADTSNDITVYTLPRL